MTNTWELALSELPTELASQIKNDGYVSAPIFTQCFRTEDLLDRYVRGLLLVRKVIQVEDLDEDNVMFSPLMGAMRGLWTAARSHEAAQERALNTKRQAIKLGVTSLALLSHLCVGFALFLIACSREIAEVEELERAKAEAKASAKQTAKDNNKLSMADKGALEETLSMKHPGTPGLSGKCYSAAGKQFVHLLIKSRKDGSYDLPQWEERRALCSP